MKKIFTLFAALMMVLSMFAANIPAGTKLYLTPNANWKNDNARFAAYFFGNGEAWVSMTKVEGETDLYELTSPSKEFTNVIFCRMNPSASANNWNNKWNQTADLTYDGSLNHYTVKEGTWDKGGGTWSIWPIPAEKTYKDITITVVASATPKIHWWGAGDKLADSNWDARPEMTATGAENTYAYTLKEVDDVKGVNFIISVGDIQSADQHTTVDVTKNFKEFLPQVAVMGVNNWDGTDKMTVADDYKSASITLPLAANKAYALKLTVDANWVGGSSVNITKDKNSASFAEDTGGDGKITTDIEGDYVFTYTYADKMLTVTYPTPVEEEINYDTFIMSNLAVTPMGDFDLLEASDDMNGLSVTLGVYADGSLHPASAVLFMGEELTIVEGNITKAYNDEVAADVYTARLVVEFMGGKLGLELIMYAGASASEIEVAIEGAEVEVVETTGTLQFTATWTDSTTMVTYPVLVTVAGYEEAEFKEYEGAQISELTIGDDDNWFDFAVADAVAVFKEGNAFALEGEYTSWATGTTYYVAIEGELPVVKFNVTATAENGTVTGAGEYEEGATATLVATPAEDYQFVNWTVGDSIVSTEATYTFVVTENVALVANFELIPVVSLPGRAWAYNLALAVEGTQYTFSFQTSTDANATLVLTTEAGEELDAIELGAVKAGKNKVTLSAKELPTDVTVNWGIKMSGEAITDFVEVTDATRGIYNFYLPQGVAVDNNPESATFGTIYVAESTDGASDGGSDRADTQKRGIFVYNQYLDELNPTNVGIIPSNVTLGTTSRQAMKRIVVNPLTNEVAFAHNAEPMAVWAVAAENVGGEAKNLIEGLGFTNVNSICFTEDGTLYVLESNGYPAPGSLYKVANGVVDTIFAGYTRFGNGDNALVSDNRGGVWICQNRGQLDTYNQLTHVNAAGEIDFEVNTATPNGFESKNTARGTIAYNPAEDILAMSIGTGSTIGASLFKVTYDETTGVPALTLIGSTPSMGKNVDGLAFDYAGDLYGLSANAERFYKFAVPTENNVCTTPAAKKYAFQIKGQTYTDNNLNPYAFDLTSRLSADKSTLTVKYSLNNSKATSVNVVVYNGTEVVATVPGTTNIGKNTVEVATADLPGGVELTWAVEVNGTSVATPTLEEKIYSFYHPSGVDIDNNPENETFGMLLVNEGMQSVVSKTEGYVSAGFGAGIFAFTPSFDLIENGDKPGYNGGIEFTTTRADGTGTAYAPRRIRISEDGRIFVTSLNTDGNYLWEVNAENLNEWTPIFKGTLNDQRELVDAEGNFIAAPNNGFDVKGSGENLQLAMYSVNLSGITAAAMGGFRLHEYNLGTATEWATAPSKAIVEGKYAINYTGTQVEYDNEGGLWIASYRGTASDANPGLVHINAEGVEDAKLVWNNVRQAGIRFNNDFTKLVVAGNNGAAKKATIYTISKDANGAPVLTEEAVVDMAVVGNNLNDFAWDYAGNLYSCGNSSEKLAAWAMPYSGTVETPAAAKYAFELEYTEPVYEVYEDAITNLVIDYDNMLLIGGPSEAFQVEVVLGLGDYDRNTDAFQLLPASTISVLGSEATFIDGIASVDGIAQTATAIVHCTWNGMAIEFHLTMSAAPLEATKVVVENATIEIEKYLLFGDMYDYALKMTGVWSNEGVDYPVLVEVPVYYPEATEPYEMYSTVTVGGWGDEDPWLGFGEGYLTITPEGQKITASGVVENPMAGIAIDITISGTITPSSVENATVTVKAVKMIKNGQLIISKGDVEYNVQGAVIK